MKEFDGKTIGRNIEKRRKALGLSQIELSKKTGGKIPSTSICRYEKGSQKPGLETIYYFAKALGCSIDELVTSESGTYAVDFKSGSEEEETLAAFAMILENEALVIAEDERYGGCNFFFPKDSRQIERFVAEFKTILSIKETAGDDFERLKEKCIKKYAKKWRDEKEEIQPFEDIPF